MDKVDNHNNSNGHDVYNLPIDKRVDWLFGIAKEHSRIYQSPEATLARERYSAKHPTLVIAFKCMDGRIHIPYATKTPMGIVMPFRNIGGKFDLGWPYLGEVVSNTVLEAVKAQRRVLMLITYHYSKGDDHRGCAGFDYDCNAAKDHVYEIKKQVEYIFGSQHQTVYPLICGFETDEDALILHEDREKILELSKCEGVSADFLTKKIASMYPDMPERVLKDLLPLVWGNIEHIQEVRKSNRNLKLESEHREWVICVGRGFDFLHVPNTALIIGPYSPNLVEPISTAIGLIKTNMEKDKISKDGFLLLASAPYLEIGVDKARAELKSRFLAQYVSQVIKAQYPDMVDLMKTKTAVLNWRTRNLEVID
jgi:hypothetical protein